MFPLSNVLRTVGSAFMGRPRGVTFRKIELLESATVAMKFGGLYF